MRFIQRLCMMANIENASWRSVDCELVHGMCLELCHLNTQFALLKAVDRPVLISVMIKARLNSRPPNVRLVRLPVFRYQTDLSYSNVANKFRTLVLMTECKKRACQADSRWFRDTVCAKQQARWQTASLDWIVR